MAAAKRAASRDSRRAGAARPSGARSCARSFDAPLSLARMAARARLIGRMDAAAECRRITAPTLVVTGEAGAGSRRVGRRHLGVRQPDCGRACRRCSRAPDTSARSPGLEPSRSCCATSLADERRRAQRLPIARQRDHSKAAMTLREIPGPAGRLEALLDEPPGERRVNEQGLLEGSRTGASRGGGARTSPPAEGRDDAHQGGVSVGEGARPHRLRRAALQLPRRRLERRQLR